PNGIQNMYVENSGDRSKIILFPTTETASGYDPEPLNVNDVQLDPTTNEFFIYPEQLKNVTDFISQYKSSCSQSLMYYHPEYCYYEMCLQYDTKQIETDFFTSSSFDDLLRNTTTFAEAQAKNFIDINNNPTNWFVPNSNNPTDGT